MRDPPRPPTPLGAGEFHSVQRDWRCRVHQPLSERAAPEALGLATCEVLHETGPQRRVAGQRRGDRKRLRSQLAEASPALLDAVKAGERQLSRHGILARALAQLLGGALDVEDVIGDLEHQAEALAEITQPCIDVRVATAEQSTKP